MSTDFLVVEIIKTKLSAVKLLQFYLLMDANRSDENLVKFMLERVYILLNFSLLQNCKFHKFTHKTTK